jgi:hypothetical protein
MSRFLAPCSDRAATASILRVYRPAVVAGIPSTAAWYGEAGDLCQTVADGTGLPVEVVAGVLAAVSPLNSWGANVNLAVKIIRHHLAGDVLLTGYLGTGLRKAAAILAGEDVATTLNSPKITNFWRCIASRGTDADAVCIDRHAWDIVTNTRHRDGADRGDDRLPVRPSINGARYAWAADAYRRAAVIASREQGRQVTASEVQAVTWMAWRARYWTPGAFDGHTLSGER